MRRTRRGAGAGAWARGGLALLVLGLSAASGVAASTQDSWDAVYVAGAKVGHIHTFVEPVKDHGRDLLRVRVDMAIILKRLDDTVRMELRYGTIETPEGEVLRLDTRTLASVQEIRTHGDVINGKMTVTLEGAGQSQQMTIPWGPDVRGPYAVEQSLSRAPMKVGETRKLKMFVPDLNKVCDVTLTADAMEEVQLGEPSKRPLLRVKQKTSLEGKPRPEFDVTSWADSGGQVLKSYTPVMGGQTVYRTTKEAATAVEKGVQLDQILTSIIKVKHKINNPETRRDVTYRVGLEGDDLTQLIPNDRRQTLRSKPDRSSGTLRVKAAGPDVGEPGPARVDPEFSKPNAMITSEDPRIVELARRATEGETDPWRRAGKIGRWVFQNVQDKNFKTGFAPASEVARNLTGDCTEHGVLAAAMCRAAGIPSRVAVGLVYADRLGGFGYHLWTEVYVNRRWVAIDPSFDQTTVDAVHIKLSDTSLAGVSPLEAFLPVVRVLSKLTLEPVEIK